MLGGAETAQVISENTKAKQSSQINPRLVFGFSFLSEAPFAALLPLSISVSLFANVTARLTGRTTAIGYL
jgi:hypothetical protein